MEKWGQPEKLYGKNRRTKRKRVWHLDEGRLELLLRSHYHVGGTDSSHRYFVTSCFCALWLRQWCSVSRQWYTCYQLLGVLFIQVGSCIADHSDKLAFTVLYALCLRGKEHVLPGRVCLSHLTVGFLYNWCCILSTMISSVYANLFLRVAIPYQNLSKRSSDCGGWHEGAMKVLLSLPFVHRH